MSDPQVPVKQTPVTARDYARALLKAWKARLGVFPTKEQVGVLYAQYMVETGGTHCYNNNLGNIKEIPNDGLPYMALRGVWEIVNGKRVELPPEHPGSWFTAFESLDQGATFYLTKLRQRFGLSWPYVEKGDPDGFARALKRQRYYTADENVYAAGMRAQWAAWMKSPAFDEAHAELMQSLEAETQPDVTAPSRRPPVVSDFATVHALVPLGRPELDGELPGYTPEDDEEPDPAA